MSQRVINALFLACGILICIVIFSAFQDGYSRGILKEKDKCHTAQLQAETSKVIAITKTLESVNQLADTANSASLALNKSISATKLANDKTTQEIRHALQMSAPARAACLFDNNVMQQLAEARNRANNAATSGIATDSGGAMPGDNSAQ